MEPLLGRTAERRALDRLLDDVRGGQSMVLVLRGEKGIGKTALLDQCAERATGFRVAHVAGIEAEVEWPLAALHRLCAPMLDRLNTLPAPQRNALDIALGASAGASPDRFLLGLGVLGLLSAVAEERPLLCLVDDAHWLDGASEDVLGFVARRLQAESVAMVVAGRGPRTSRHFDALPELSLGGLDTESARSLLGRAVPGPLDNRVRDRLVAETGGNPCSLLELPSTMNAAELAGGFDVSPGPAMPSHDHHRDLVRLRALPQAAQELVLLAAADPGGDAPLVWRAADRLGIAPGALSAASDAGLLDIGDTVRFRHPTVRAAVYRAASAADRQRVHGALADVTDADRRAWHRALAAPGPDEAIAGELEQSADRARMRGGVAAAGALLERSAESTPDPSLRARRALGAAQAFQASGAVEKTQRLLSRAGAGPLTEFERSRVQVVRGRAALASGRGGDAAALLSAGARGLESRDPMFAREIHLEAISAALLAGRTTDLLAIADVAWAARAAPTGADRPQDALLDGLAIGVTEGHAAAAPLLKRAVAAATRTPCSDAEATRWLWPATHAAQILWDYERAETLADRHVAIARRTGAIALLPMALDARAGLHLLAGESAAASALIDEATRLGRLTGTQAPPCQELALRAFRGQQSDVVAADGGMHADPAPEDQHVRLVHTARAQALLLNGLGRYSAASAAAQRGSICRPELGTSIWVLPELIEAAARAGQRAIAIEALQQLAQSTREAGTDWALGTEARCRALVSASSEAEPLFREAIERLGRTRVRSEHARTQLLFGEWLRREQRRVDARPHLRAAFQRFEEMGMEAFAGRARRELAATGETVRKRRAELRDELTAQEREIAQLASDGLSNPQIAERLFLSPRTVEWHLRKVFFKLDIKSRRGLPGALSGPLARTHAPKETGGRRPAAHAEAS